MGEVRRIHKKVSRGVGERHVPFLITLRREQIYKESGFMYGAFFRSQTYVRIRGGVKGERMVKRRCPWRGIALKKRGRGRYLLKLT